MGEWIVTFDKSKLVRKLKPLNIQTTIEADTTNVNAAKVVACSGTNKSNPTPEQEWDSYELSRTYNTEYQNDTPNPIVVDISMYCRNEYSGTVASATLLIDDVAHHRWRAQPLSGTGDYSFTTPSSLVVPPGSKYKLIRSGTGSYYCSIETWKELR